MSEPVGNAPRGTTIPENSHKGREAAAIPAAPSEPKEEATKIVVGKVTSKKPSWLRRAARSMVADDATHVGDFILVDILVPAAKNLIRDIIVGGTDRTLFGPGRSSTSRIRGGGPASAGPVSSMRDRYAQMAEERRPPVLSREQRARHEFNLITLDSRAEAIDVIEALVDRVTRYGQASVTDLYDFVGVTGSFADQRWGWTDLSTADIRQNRGGWLIDLPQPEPLR